MSKPDERNSAKDIIENFMIAANGAVACYLASRSIPSLRRVVRTPKRWERIVELAYERHFSLPSEPDAKALERFLVSVSASDPLRFPDLSLAVIKLLGPGEYIVERPGDKAVVALQSGGKRIHALDGPEPALSRPDHSAIIEGLAWRAPRSLRRRRPGRFGRAVHRDGGQREEG